MINSKIITKIHDKYYDLTKFNHPGGKIPLDLANSRDATELFNSHHQFSNRSKIDLVLSKYEVNVTDIPGFREIQSFGCFDWEKTNNDPFVIELKDEVRKELGTDIKANFWRIIEGVVIGIFLVFSYYLFAMGYWISLLLLPLFAWLLSVNTYHDASHFAVSRNGNINSFITYLCPYFSSPFMWYHQHIIGHHNYTNVPKLDPDLYHSPTMVRQTLSMRYRPAFAYQKFTVWLTWVTSVQYLSLVHTIRFYLSGEAFKFNRAVNVIPFTKKRMIQHIIGRILNVFVLHILPFFYVGLTLKGLVWVSIPMIIYSIIFMICTQINHLTPESTEMKDENFMRHQIITSNNIGTDSYLVYLLTGGLNFQIEHHLFPSVNHCHLHRISPIVKRLCTKYGISYQEYSTLFEALVAHYQHIVNMSIDNTDNTDSEEIKG